MNITEKREANRQKNIESRKRKVEDAKADRKPIRENLLRALESATKREAQGDPASSDSTIKIVCGTSEEYLYSTRWERDATPKEAEEYESWSK